MLRREIQNENGHTVRTVYWDSIGESLDFPINNDANLQHITSSMKQNAGKESWWGLDPNEFPSCTGHTVAEVLNTGWESGVKRSEEYFGQINVPVLPSVKRRRVWTDFGDEFNQQKVYTGNVSSAWQVARRNKRVNKKNNVLIALDIGGNCNREAEEFFWRGALTAQLVRRLVESGRNVKVVAGNRVRNLMEGRGPRYFEHSFVVKEFTQPLNLSHLVCITACCGFFRSIGFRSLCAQEERVCEGLGQSINYIGDSVPDTHPNLYKLVITDIWTKGQANDFAERLPTLLAED